MIRGTNNLRANVIYTCLLYLHCMLCIHSSACSCWLFFTSLSVYHFLLPVFLLFASLCFIYLARAFMFLGVPVQRFLHLSPLLNLNQLSSFHPIFFFFVCSQRMHVVSIPIFFHWSWIANANRVAYFYGWQLGWRTSLLGGRIEGSNKRLSKMLPNQAQANFWLLWVSLIVMQTAAAAVDCSLRYPKPPILAPFAARAATALTSYGSN